MFECLLESKWAWSMLCRYLDQEKRYHHARNEQLSGHVADVDNQNYCENWSLFFRFRSNLTDILSVWIEPNIHTDVIELVNLPRYILVHRIIRQKTGALISIWITLQIAYANERRRIMFFRSSIENFSNTLSHLVEVMMAIFIIAK